MTTRMSHPQHGWTHAYTPGEVKDLLERGWRVDDKEHALREALQESMRLDPPKRKPGRPRKES